MIVIDGYVRTTDAGIGEAGSLQRAQIRRWAADRGRRIGRIFEETVGGTAEPPLAAGPAGGSASAAAGGSDALRPLLRAALERVESQESDGIVTPRLVHLGDSFSQTLHAMERVQAAGGTLVSLGDRFDLSTPSGRLMFRLLLSIGDGW